MTIRIKCVVPQAEGHTLYRKDYGNDYRWPSWLACRPVIGDRVRGFERYPERTHEPEQCYRDLPIVAIAHTVDDGGPLLLIELGEPA